MAVLSTVETCGQASVGPMLEFDWSASTTAPASSRGPSPAYVRLVTALVHRGHGIEALCFFLALARDALTDLVIHLDLPTPPDLAFRPGGGFNAWTQDDYGRLFRAWQADWRCGAISETLGRSKSSIWAKARRLGLPGRDRRSLRQPTTIVPARLRQLDLFRRGADAWPPSPDIKEWLARGTTETIIVRRKKGRRDVDWTKEFREHFEKRAFSGQKNKCIADDLGIPVRAVTSMKCQMHITMPLDLLCNKYDPEKAVRNIADLRYTRRACQKNPHIWFWRRPQGDRIARRDRPRGAFIG